MNEAGYELITKINALRKAHKQYRVPFIFKKKDYVSFVKTEMNEMKRLLFAFRVRTDQDAEEEKLLQEEREREERELEARKLMEIERARRKGKELTEAELQEKLEYEPSSDEETRQEALLSPLRIV